MECRNLDEVSHISHTLVLSVDSPTQVVQPIYKSPCNIGEDNQCLSIAYFTIRFNLSLQLESSYFKHIFSWNCTTEHNIKQEIICVCVCMCIEWYTITLAIDVNVTVSFKDGTKLLSIVWIKSSTQLFLIVDETLIENIHCSTSSSFHGRASLSHIGKPSKCKP